jgi:hypothetical protein
MPIQLHELLPLLVRCCTGLRGRLLPAVDDWLNEDGTLSYFRIGHVLVDWIVERFAAGDYGFSDDFFSLMERLLTEGSPEVQDVAATGILEGLHHQRRLPPELWVPLLGPKARAYLIVWDRFHGAVTPGLQGPA